MLEIYIFDMNCNTLQLKGRVDPLCIVADDSVYLALVTLHLSKSSHVISLFPGLRDKGLQYLQAIADANGFLMNHVEVLEKKKTCLTMHDTHQRKVSVFQNQFVCHFARFFRMLICFHLLAKWPC